MIEKLSVIIKTRFIREKERKFFTIFYNVSRKVCSRGKTFDIFHRCLSNAVEFQTHSPSLFVHETVLPFTHSSQALGYAFPTATWAPLFPTLSVPPRFYCLFSPVYFHSCLSSVFQRCPSSSPFSCPYHTRPFL